MQLLDCAQAIIQERGLSSFTMDALAKEADVSNPLIYKYFNTRLELLQELLTRENNRFNLELRERLVKSKDYEDIVAIVVTMNFEDACDGNILSILRSQPDVRTVLEAFEAKESWWLGRFLVKRLAEVYPLTQTQAEQLVVMGSGASRTAAEHFSRFGGNRNRYIRNTVQFIRGGIQTLAPAG